MKFERVDGTQDWFQITVPALNEYDNHFTIRANGNWAYESKQGYEFLEDTADYLSDFEHEMPKSLVPLQNTGGKVLSLKVIEFVTPCKESHE